MLLGERLGGRHQRALAACLDRAQQRVERDDGLARADVALQQPLHRHGLCEVEVDLGDRALLVLGERERQHRAVALDERRPGAPSAAATESSSRERRDDELQREQLVEREPAPRCLGLRLGLREVDRCERVAAQRQLELGG